MTTFQSKVFLKTQIAGIIVSKAVAEQVEKVFSDRFVDGETVVKISGMSYLKNQIRAVEVRRDLEDNSRKHAEDNRKEFDQEVSRRRAMLADKNLYQKTYMFDFMCKIANVIVTGDMRTRAIQANRAFFASNPHRTCPDPVIYKQIIPQLNSGPLADAGWRVVENAVRRDIYLSTDRNHSS